MGRLPVITLMGIILAISSACTVSPPQARPAISSLESSAIRFPHVPPCPPTLEDGPVQRDLTVAFERRVYLLESGEICAPSMETAFSLSVIPVPSAPEETDAADPIADLTDYRGGRR